MQQSLIGWFHHAHRSLGVADENLLFAVPNGGARNPITGAILKREGVRRGIPDLLLAVPRGGYHGLFIELKTFVGKVSPEQLAMQHSLTKQGYSCMICRGASQAIGAIENYLKVSCESCDWMGGLL